MTEEAKNHLRYLFKQFLSNRISEKEYAELWNILRTEGRDFFSSDLFNDELKILWEEVKDREAAMKPGEWDEKMNQLISATGAQGNKSDGGRISGRKVYRGTAAAIAFLVIAGSLYFYRKPVATQKVAVVKKQVKNDILPGGNKAVLILANGSRITLDSTVKGIITRQGKTSIIQSGNGQIAYKPPTGIKPAEVVYNMVTTPRGGKYQIMLADGSKVWLNSASTLRFPTSFPGNKRMIEMNGEAYFEIKEDAAKPFIVSVDGIKVKVLGTHFNIMAYDDEPFVKTTLLEGSVRVAVDNGQAALLKPGEQALVNKENKIQAVKNVNIDQVVAWKNNLFWFDENTIQEVMREVGRWYDANVEIEGSIPQHFTGSIPRNVNVLRVFEVLHGTGNLHFEVTDHKIIVKP